MALTVTQTPVVNRNGFDSFWVSVFNPINFSVSNTKFPINQESDIFNISSFGNSNGLLRINLGSDADYIEGEIIQLTGVNIDSYNTTARIIDVVDSRNLIVNLNFNSQLTSGGTIQKIFQDYEIVYRVSAGLPPTHKWVSIKPFEEIGVTSSKPNNNNVASIDIKDFVQEKIQTDNNYLLNSLPNDVNLWTAFSIEYAERYKGFEGDDPNDVPLPTTVSNYTDNGGLSKITIGSPRGFQTGDYIRFSNFDDDNLNRRFRVIRIIDQNNLIINLEYDPYLTLNGNETATRFLSDIISITSDFEQQGDLFYAVNAKQDGESNMTLLVNQLVNSNLAENTSVFKELYFRKGQQIDLAYIVDKDLSDRLNSSDFLSIERKAYDAQGNLLDTSYYFSKNEQEGVYRLDFNEETAEPETPLISFISFANGIIPLFVLNSDVGRWEVDGVIFNQNDPVVSVTPGTLVEYYAPDEANVTRIVLDGCGITNNQILDLSVFTNLTEFRATGQDFRLSVGEWILQPNIEIDTTNSILTKESYDFTQDQLITIAGGTLDTSGGSYTGNPGATFLGREWIVGTVVFDLSPGGDQITYEKFLALTTTNGGTGWAISTIKTLCLKDVDFFLGQDVAETSDFIIPIDYSIDRPSGSDVIQSVDLSGIVGGTFTIRLLTPDGNTQVAGNLLQINTLLNTSDRTGFILRVGGVPLDVFTFLTITILDFPRALSICGSVDYAGRFSDAYLDLFFAGFVDPEEDDTLNQWNDVTTGNDWEFPAPNTSARPLIVGELVRFNQQEYSLITNAAKSAWNFLHDGTTDYSVIFAADLSSSIDNGFFNVIFGTNAISSSAATGLTIASAQTSTAVRKGLVMSITLGSSGNFVYNTNNLQVIDGMAVYAINIPIGSAGEAKTFFNKIETSSFPRENTPTVNNSTINATFGRPSNFFGGSGGAFGDLADFVIIKNANSSQITNIRRILAKKNISQCTKFIKYFLIKDSEVSGGEVVDFEFTRDLTYDGIFIPELTAIDETEITGSATVTLYSDNTKVTTLATGINDINDWFANNFATESTEGLVLTVEATPTDDDGIVTIDITDYADANSPCGFFNGGGIPAIGTLNPVLYVDSRITGSIIGESLISSWEGLSDTTFDATQNIDVRKPSVSIKNNGKVVSFTKTLQSLVFGNVLNDVLSGTVQCTIYWRGSLTNGIQGGNQVIFMKHGDGNVSENNRQIWCAANNGGIGLILYQDVTVPTNAINIRANINNPEDFTDTEFTFVARIDSSLTGVAKFTAFVNGVKITDYTNASTLGNGNPLTIAAGTAPLALGAMVGANGNSAIHTRSELAGFAIFDELLTDDQCEELSINI